MGHKGKDVKLGGAQRDNDNADYLFSNNGSESEGENDAGGKDEDGSGREGENDASIEGENSSDREDENDAGKKVKNTTNREDKNNTSKEVKDNASREDEDNNSGKGKDDNSKQDEDNASGNKEILNMKLSIEDNDETLNLGEIVAGKLAFYCIANLLVDIPARSIVALDHFIISLVFSIVFLVFGFSVFGIATPGFLALGYLIPDPFVFLIPGSSVLFWLSSSVIPLVSLDAFFHKFSLTSFIDGGIVKLLTEVIANPFGNNLSVITHCSHNNYTSE